MISAATSSSFFVIPGFVWVILVTLIVSAVARAITKKNAKAKRVTPFDPPPQQPSMQQQPYAQQQQPYAQHQAYPPQPGTPYSNSSTASSATPYHGQNMQPQHRTPPSANSSPRASDRWRAEQALKPLLHELDQRRRSGLISTEQYAAEREQILRQSR